MIWAAVAVLSLVVAALLLRPLWWPRRRVAEAAPELAFYRDQLAEIERDRGLGYLNDAQAQSARLEVQRRILALDTPTPSPPRGEGGGEGATGKTSPQSSSPLGNRLALAGSLAVILLAGSLALYLRIGSPGASTVVASAAPGGMQRHATGGDAREFNQLIEQLQAKLKAQPSDIEGWMLLARSLRTVDRLPEAAEAYFRALALSGGKAEIASIYAELLVEIAEGQVTPQALDLFRQALAREPGEARARFYVGLWKLQSGDARAALEDWAGVVRDAPPGAAYALSVREQIAETAKESNLPMPALPPPSEVAMARPPMMPPAGGPPAGGPSAGGSPAGAPPAGGPVAGGPASGSAPRGPSQADMAAAANMSPEDRQQMIRGMVENLAGRLKDNPNDVEGWLRLARAYGVMGEPDKQRDALGQAAIQAPQRLDVLNAYAQALFTPEKAADVPPPEYVRIMRRILALEPTNAQALWYVGNDEAQAGNKGEAAALYRRLLDRLPPNAPLRTQVQGRLDAVQGG